MVIGSALIIGAFLVNNRRPSVETQQPDAAFVRASGKCAECHSPQQFSVVQEYEMSAHARKGIKRLGSAKRVLISLGSLLAPEHVLFHIRPELPDRIARHLPAENTQDSY